MRATTGTGAHNNNNNNNNNNVHICKHTQNKSPQMRWQCDETSSFRQKLHIPAKTISALTK